MPEIVALRALVFRPLVKGKENSKNDIDGMLARENKGTEREAPSIGRDVSCPRKLFLDERKSLF